MAVGVVDLLEVVDVGHHDRQLAAVAGARLPQSVDAVLEPPPVGEPGQRVAAGLGLRAFPQQLVAQAAQEAVPQVALHAPVGVEREIGGRGHHRRADEPFGHRGRARQEHAQIGCCHGQRRHRREAVTEPQVHVR